MVPEPPRIPDDRSNIALPNDYELLEVGTSVSLYQGPMELKARGNTYAGEGGLTLELRGDPHLEFWFFTSGRIPANLVDAGDIIIAAQRAECKGRAQWVKAGIGKATATEAGGTIDTAGMEVLTRTSAGKPEAIGHVLFHLLNFPSFAGTDIRGFGQTSAHGAAASPYPGRVVFAFGPWRVTLDRLRHADKILKIATAEHSYAFTHVGILRRSDNKLFSPEEATETLEALSWFFSWVRGARCACALPQGNRFLDQPLWRLWQAPTTDPARLCRTWFAEQAPYGCFAAAALFEFFWRDATRRKWLILAISLYCAANASEKDVELRLAESQIALELLTCVAFLEENSLMSERAFEALSAADKVRVLLFWLRCPVDVPGKYPALLRFAIGRPSTPKLDAPEAITEIRNAIIHPTRSNRAKRDAIPREAIVEAWQVNLWYIELALLKLLDYQGCYFNRTAGTGSGAIDTVPWSK